MRGNGCAAWQAGSKDKRPGIIRREQEMLRQPDGFLSMTVLMIPRPVILSAVEESPVHSIVNVAEAFANEFGRRLRQPAGFLRVWAHV